MLCEIYLVRFQVLMVADTKMTAFWDIALCSLMKVYRHFRGAYFLHHQGNETLMMTAVCTSEISVYFHKTTWRYIPESCHLHELYLSKAVPWYTMEVWGGRGGIAPAHSRPQHYMGVSGEWLASRPGHTFPQKIHWTGGWVGLRAGLDTETRGKLILPLLGIEPRSPSHPVRSQTLYWLSYPGFQPLSYLL
jgi:hypothetical protein